MRDREPQHNGSGSRIVIEKLVYGGHGLGRLPEGQIVFVRDALPGEAVQIRETYRKHGVLWAKDFELVQASKDRTENRCANGRTCGGCSLIFMDESREQREKEAIFENAVQRAGFPGELALKTYHFPFQESRFRGSIHIRNGKLGFFEKQSHSLSPIEGCQILPRSALDLFIKLSDGPVRDIRDGELRFAMHPCLSAGQVSDQSNDLKPIVVDLKLEKRVPNKLKKDLLRHWQSLTTLKGGILNQPGEKPTLFGSHTLDINWKNFVVKLSPTSFFQANPSSWTLFWTLLENWSNRLPDKDGWIWDVHAGAGFLASVFTGRRCFGSEPHPESFKQLKRNLPDAYQGTAESAILKALVPNPLSALVLDPPRTGLSRNLISWILEQGPPSISMFSCDLGTFCRDMGKLMNRYEIAEPLHLLNVVPGSSRFEIFTSLVRK